MKKIGLFTIYRAKNYGTQLQAQALYQILQGLTHNCDIRILSEEEKVKPDLFNPFSKNPCTYIKRFCYWKKHQKYMTQYNLGGFDETYDIIVIGSDELWNVRNPDFEHSSRYIGKNINSNRKIVYAVSCNRGTSMEFIQQYGATPFESLNAISCRDKMTQKLVQDILAVNPVRVLDPTFLVEFESEKIFKKNYLMVYGYQFDDDEVANILTFAAAKHVKVISVGFEHHWCEFFVLCSSKEFIGYIQNATYVVTSTFHGTVFSIKYNKQFASYVRENCKVEDLLNHFSLVERNATGSDLYTIFANTVDYRKVNQQIERECEESLRWLERQMVE